MSKTHSSQAALRGEPSYVWRSGQERRLKMVAEQVPLTGSRILEAGAGLGTYAMQFKTRYGADVHLFDIEADRIRQARRQLPLASVAVGEAIPYAANRFDLVFSNEVIEHVQGDRAFAREMVRVTRPGGYIALFCPNRGYPFETHGHYWRGSYHFGNTPLINYLPDRWRNQLAPHVRAYSSGAIRGLVRRTSGGSSASPHRFWRL
ncbi:MAG: class I SAM-dependent methyltransferase, partial [Anaerolineae bacterium]|nr:class I SAM-dependent methyltransferase [Anaerolineae bacterium]